MYTLITQPPNDTFFKNYLKFPKFQGSMLHFLRTKNEICPKINSEFVTVNSLLLTL